MFALIEPRAGGLAERVRVAADGDDLRRLGMLPWRVLGHLAVLHLLHDGNLRLDSVAPPRAKPRRIRPTQISGFHLASSTNQRGVKKRGGGRRKQKQPLRNYLRRTAEIRRGTNGGEAPDGRKFLRIRWEFLRVPWEFLQQRWEFIPKRWEFLQKRRDFLQQRWEVPQ